MFISKTWLSERQHHKMSIISRYLIFWSYIIWRLKLRTSDWSFGLPLGLCVSHLIKNFINFKLCGLLRFRSDTTKKFIDSFLSFPYTETISKTFYESSLNGFNVLNVHANCASHWFSIYKYTRAKIEHIIYLNVILCFLCALGNLFIIVSPLVVQ